eukprot:7415301-Lingulodinium_polyedra.AAC.1
MFSSLQCLNFFKQDSADVEMKMKEAFMHLGFAVFMCIQQDREGRKYMFEHPATAQSFATAILNRLITRAHGTRVNFDFCCFGMTSEDEKGTGLVKKPTGIITNSAALAKELATKKCRGDHRHVQLMGGRAAACQRYPDSFRKLVVRTVMQEKGATT